MALQHFVTSQSYYGVAALSYTYLRYIPNLTILPYHPTLPLTYLDYYAALCEVVIKPYLGLLCYRVRVFIQHKLPCQTSTYLW